jgi:hypothetical protein
MTTPSDPADRASGERLPHVVEGDFGPVTMRVDRTLPGIFRIEITGEGGHVDAAFRRWRHNLSLASKAGLDMILVVLDLTGKVIPESDLERMIHKLAAFDINRFRVAIVQTRHERQNQDELGVLLAMEQGMSVGVFPDEASALLWLRHGAR